MLEVRVRGFGSPIQAGRSADPQGVRAVDIHVRCRDLGKSLGGADLSAVGPGLGMAVLTTLYGAVLANVVVLPLNAKLQAYLARRVLVMQMVIEGTQLLHRREYPTRIERALRAYVGAGRPAAIEKESTTRAPADSGSEWNDDLFATERAA